MLIIIDFDRTLFNTDKFKKTLLKVFLSKGISEKQYLAAKKKMTEKVGIYDYKILLDFLIPQLTNQEKSDLSQKIENLLHHLKRFLYSDTLDFLKLIRRQKQQLVLLTYGQKDFQLAKVRGCGLEKYFDQIIITQKFKFLDLKKLLKKFKEDKSVFIDDRGREMDLVKKHNPLMVSFWLKRKNSEYKNESSKFADYYVRRLKDINLFLPPIFKINFKQPNPLLIEKAGRVLKNGGVIIYPTETAYGLGADALNLRAVKKIFQIKKRSRKKPLPLIVADLKMAKEYAEFDDWSLKLAKKYWPGPLTLILSKKKIFSLVTAGSPNVALRVSSHPLARFLTKKLKRPLVATSANLAGQGNLYNINKVEEQFKNQRLQPDLILDSGVLPRRRPSTIIKVEGNKIKVLRK